MAIILMPLPRNDFDPTETGVPWLELTRQGHQVRFATPDGGIAIRDGNYLSARWPGDAHRVATDCASMLE